MKLKKWVSVVVLTTVLVGMTSVANIVAAGSVSADGKAVVDELAKSTYAGRQAGTAGYAKAVDYLEKKMIEVGMQPILGDKQYKQSYEGGVAELTKEKVTLNGQSLEIMKDYMPFSRTISKTASFKKVYYVGAGLQTDYVGKTPGLVVFNWYDKYGKFPGGVMDRIQIAVANGATGVLIVTNGELAVGNYEHPLNANEITVPALYVSTAVATKMGVPSDYKAKELTGNEFTVDMTVKRTASVKTDNLIGLIPGKQESRAVLWVTNIDGFGSLPDGRHFESAKAGAVSAAMMLDMAKYYSENQPEYTMLFAFVGSKWKGQEGISALVNKLNFDHIDTTIDLYAMGGTGTFNLFYTDPMFEGIAKKVSDKVLLNTDLGNALSSVVREKTKNLLFLRDNNTWVDQSLTDTAANVDAGGYQKGLESLMELSSKLMTTLDKSNNAVPIPDSPVFMQVSLQSPKVTLNQTETEHFIVYADDANKGFVTGTVLRELEKIYTRVNYYNYNVVQKNKAVAMFMENGEQAAVIAGRDDLVQNSKAAGGGFANYENDTEYLYMREAGFYGTVSHELNHAIASANPFFELNSGLQEWQGQSHFIRYSFSDRSKYIGDITTSLVNEGLYHEGDVPLLRDYITNYSTKVDIAWFTANKPHPVKWIYTYYLAGSMYAYLADQYGDKVSRRAMYRNYQDYTKFKTNMTDETGLTFDEFLKQWSHWMLNSGTPLSPVAPEKKQLINKNNWFDHMLLFTLNSNNINKSTNEESSSSKNSGQGTAIGTNAITIARDGSIHFNLNSTDLSSVKNHDSNVVQDQTSYKFTLRFTSKKVWDFAVFIQPDTVLYRGTIKSGENKLEFSIRKSDVEKATKTALVANIYDKNAHFMRFPLNELVGVPMAKPSVVTIKSTNFKVDSINYTISIGKTSVAFATLKKNLTIPKNATITIFKADGITKISSGNVPVGAKVKVTAENGATTKVYTIKK